MTVNNSDQLLVVLYSYDINNEEFYHGFERTHDDDWNWRRLTLNDYGSLTDDEIEKLKSYDLLIFELKYNQTEKSLLVIPETVKVKRLSGKVKKPIYLQEKNVIIAKVAGGKVSLVYSNFLTENIEQQVNVVEVFVSTAVKIEDVDNILAIIGRQVFPHII